MKKSVMVMIVVGLHLQGCLTVLTKGGNHYFHISIRTYLVVMFVSTANTSI